MFECHVNSVCLCTLLVSEILPDSTIISVCLSVNPSPQCRAQLMEQLDGSKDKHDVTTLLQVGG